MFTCLRHVRWPEGEGETCGNGELVACSTCRSRRDILAGESQLEARCCGGLANLDYSKMDISVMADIFSYCDWTDLKFKIAILAVAFNPLFWNISYVIGKEVKNRIDLFRKKSDSLLQASETIYLFLIKFPYEKSVYGLNPGNERVPFLQTSVGRWEHRTRSLTKLFGSPFTACYSVAVIIVLLSVYRTYSFTEAMRIQPKLQLLDSPAALYIGFGLLLIGTLLVLSSFFALGFTGTFLGDYFGVLMEGKVLTFPFNVMENPMYWGSTLNYLGLAIMNASPTGLVLTAWVAAVYKVAILFERPFTEEVYRQKEKTLKDN